jgi:hypothetical protein
MTDANAGTAPETGEAPAEGTAPAAPTTGTPSAPDEVTTLRSRTAGLDAKVTELQKAAAAAEARAEAAAAKLAEYEAGKVNADEALRAQLEAEKAETAKARREAALNRIEAKYPETFGVLGEAAASLTEDQLAASEARMSGVPAETTTPPINGGINAPRPPSTRKSINDMSAAELRAHMMSQFTSRDSSGNPV